MAISRTNTEVQGAVCCFCVVTFQSGHQTAERSMLFDWNGTS